MKLIILCLCAVLALGSGQRITTIQLDGVQYFVSRMNPYSPELNYFLAYQYCRSLGLQLASFETKEKSESMTQYLQNAGYNKYDFWTSGNRLGTGMFLWMSTGLPFNATFDFFENSNDAVAASLIDPHDHNSNTSPQRTARDSSNGLEKGCVMLKTPSLRWAPDDCSAVKDFICEQTRCYYYNYGSIPVSSAQGRPITQTKPTETLSATTSAITTTTAATAIITSTPLPLLLSSSTLAPYQVYTTLIKENEESDEEKDAVSTIIPDEHHHDDSNETENDQSLYDDNTEHDHESTDEDNEKHLIKENDDEDLQPTVEQRLKQITEEIEKYSSSSENNDNNAAEIGRQSFFSLSDLIKTLRPNDKKVPQIDSDYSNTMRVLGEHTSMVNSNNDNNNSGDKIKTIDIKLTNRSIKI